MEQILWIPTGAGLLALAFVLYLVIYVLRADKGTELMVRISASVQAGARAFLKREYGYVALFVVVTGILLSLPRIFDPEIALGWETAIAFVIGAVISGLAGFIGMTIATRANCRTAQGAVRAGLPGALSVAVSGGAVMGLTVVGLALLGLVLVYVLFQGRPVIVNGYALGASFVALFARSGGGIYTKGADMAADLVGKVEAGIPEDDPRNPAVIADNVGDNVGDVAGLGADLLESYVESIIATMAIASGIGIAMSQSEVGKALSLLPLHICSAGIVASIVGIICVRLFGRRNAQAALMGGTYTSAILTMAATYFIVSRGGISYQIGERTYSVLGPFYATVAGVISGMVIGFTSEFFTSSKYLPVRKLAERAQSGPALAVTEGLAVGMQSTAIPVIILAAAIVVAYHVAGILGVAMAAVGMLATTGMVVTVDSYGPIADNAGGIAEMAGLEPGVRKITDRLDAVGNTTAAIGKGFAIGSAAFAALGLVVAFLGTAGVSVSDLRDPKVMAGLLIGAMLPFVFSSLLFRAVSRCAFGMIQEVRRQFREIPGLMEGKVMPDSAACVDISTRAAISGMILPGIMVIVIPVVIGFILGAEGLAGALVGAVATGLMLGLQMANSGGAMDNAKKYIEEGNFGGKGTEAHRAAVVGDTVGDPLKDTVGPSINILIKLMAVVSLVVAPLFIGR